MVRQSRPAEGPHDRELELRVTEYLRGKRRQPLRRVGVQAHNGTVILSGTVPTFYDKQLCLCCRRQVPGVSSLVDNIHVADSH